MINLTKRRSTVLTVAVICLVFVLLVVLTTFSDAEKISSPFFTSGSTTSKDEGILSAQKSQQSASATGHLTPTATQVPEPKPTVKFLINFGDSFSRTGFHYEKTGPGSESNPRPENPVGNPKWPGWTSSGGMNWIGYMVSELNSTPALAYNFARSGSTVDRNLIQPVEPGALDKFTFLEQVEQFTTSIGNKPTYAAWTPKNSVIGIWFGVNDVRRSYQDGNPGKLFPLVVDQLVDQAQILYDMGFRRFLFFDVPPLNLLPLYQNASATNYPKLLYAVDEFNRNLRHGFAKFTEANFDASTFLIETADIFWEAYLNPASLGADDNQCFHPRNGKCIWSDNLHPGKKIHRLIAERASKAARL